MRPSARWLPPAIAVAAYLNGLRGDWLDDDPVAIVDNPDVPCPRGLRGLFDNLHDVLAHDFWGTPLADATSHLSWRPLTILAFRAQHAVVGYDKFSFHAANALLHAAVTAALASVLRPLLRRRSQRAAAVLLFAVHAVHVEAVTNCVGRAELLSALAFCGSLRAARRAAALGGGSLLRRLGWLVAALALAATAMLCKEVASRRSSSAARPTSSAAAPPTTTRSATRRLRRPAAVARLRRRRAARAASARQRLAIAAILGRRQRRRLLRDAELPRALVLVPLLPQPPAPPLAARHDGARLDHGSRPKPRRLLRRSTAARACAVRHPRHACRGRARCAAPLAPR